MIVGARVEELMKAAGLSQAELARRVGVAQPTIYKLLRTSKRGSAHLHRIARVLGTTPAYLAGDTDNPDENAPPPLSEPQIAYVTLPVALPSVEALAQMFEALLAGIDRGAPEAERARLLAERLPIGLSQLRELRPGLAPARRRAAPAAADAGPAMPHREPQP